jgi:hypothetical protein
VAKTELVSNLSLSDEELNIFLRIKLLIFLNLSRVYILKI